MQSFVGLVLILFIWFGRLEGASFPSEIQTTFLLLDGNERLLTSIAANDGLSGIIIQGIGTINATLLPDGTCSNIVVSGVDQSLEPLYQVKNEESLHLIHTFRDSAETFEINENKTKSSNKLHIKILQKNNISKE